VRPERDRCSDEVAARLFNLARAISDGSALADRDRGHRLSGHLPASSWIADLTGLNPLPPTRFSWYGDTNVLAVDLPIDGVYRINAESPNLGAKVAWFKYLAGAVDITARRVDGSAPEIKTKTSDGYRPTGFNPSSIEFTDEGCWQVTGTLQGRELIFVMFVRRAAIGEANP